MTKEYVPIVLREGTYDANELAAFCARFPIFNTQDLFLLQCEELFEIRNPSFDTSDKTQAFSRFLAERTKDDPQIAGDWIYYPWNGILIHSISEIEYKEIRTNRNRNLITKEEQGILAEKRLGIVGLSVGGAIATSFAYQGIGNTYRLADFDTLSTANLNRVRARLADVGLNKSILTARTLTELDPYLSVHCWEEGLSMQNIDTFIGTGDSALHLLVDEIDDFVMKIRLRVAARTARIPVLMFANVGDRIVIDIERYDLTPDLPIMNGILGTLPDELLARGGDISDMERHDLAVRFVSKEEVPPRAIQSLMEIGKSLSGRPQLSSTVTTASGIASLIARRILLGEEVASGRQILDLSAILFNEPLR